MLHYTSAQDWTTYRRNCGETCRWKPISGTPTTLEKSLLVSDIQEVNLSSDQHKAAAEVT
jgi:hypothetical protein